MAVAHRHKKIHVLDFFGYIAAVRNHFRSQLSVRNSSIQLARTSSHPANGPDALGLDGSNLWNGLVDDLEGKALGERLGDCRESDLRSHFPSTIHYPFATDLGSSSGCVAYRSSWIGRVHMARQTGQRAAPVLKDYQSRIKA